MPNPTASVQAEIKAELTVLEVLGAGVEASDTSGARITHNQFNKSISLTGTTSVPVSKVASFRKALSGGSATIDLTSLTQANGAALDATGLKLQALLAVAVSGNTSAVTLEKGATNGYELMGGSWSIRVFPGEPGLPGFALIHTGEDAPDIGPTAKTIDLSGTGSESVDISMVFG